MLFIVIHLAFKHQTSWIFIRDQTIVGNVNYFYLILIFFECSVLPEELKTNAFPQ